MDRADIESLLPPNLPQPIARWIAIAKSKQAERLDDLIDENCVFVSPVVHKPQNGKAITLQYLTAAIHVFVNPTFRYLHYWSAENSAVLEFVVTIGDVEINGGDYIWWNQDGRITCFKVMVRPLKAMNLLQQAMGAQLKKI